MNRSDGSGGSLGGGEGGRGRRISRRHWFGAVSAPVAAAAAVAVGAGLVAPGPAGAQTNPSVDKARAGTRTFNVRDFGAAGDGKTLDTAAVQRAIDAAAGDRGGVVLVPAGVFLIGPIELKTNVTLHIAAEGKLLATTDPQQYHPARGIPLQGDHTMGDGNVGLITAADAANVSIEGRGTIDGQGAAVRAAGSSGNRRPHLLLFYRCNNLSIRDVYMYHSAYHTCRICNCSHVRLDGIRINSRVTGNNDGFHFVSAEYVNMSNCNVRCQDDACALFGSCRFIMVTNCSFSTRWAVFRFGGGVAENIVVSNCLMDQVFGCPIKLRCAAGSRYENMSFSDLVFKDVTGPISIGAGPQRPPREAATRPQTNDVPAPTSGPGAGWPGGVVRNISFRNITGNVITTQMPLDDSSVSSSNNPGEMHSAIILNGVDGTYLENISLSDIRLTFGGGGTAEEAARRELPQIAGEYFHLGPIPAYGLYARNVRGLTVNNMRLQVATPEMRPAVVFDKVRDAALYGLSAEGNPQAESLIRFQNSSDVYLSAPRVLTAAAVFLRVEGAATEGITVDGGELRKAQTPLAFADGATERAVTLRR